MIDLILGLHLLSAHSPSQNHHNNQNLGIYASVENWEIGFYKNTHFRTSIRAGYRFDFGPISLHTSLVTGYKSYPVPVAISSLKISPLPLRIWYAPKTFQGTTQILHLSLETSF